MQPTNKYRDFIGMITNDIKSKLLVEKSKQKTYKILSAIGFFLFIGGSGLFNNGYPSILGLSLLAGAVLMSSRQAVSVNVYTVYSEMIDQIAAASEIAISDIPFSLSDDEDRKLEAIKKLVETNNLDGYEVLNDTRIVKTGKKREDVFSPTFLVSKKTSKADSLDVDDPFHAFYSKKANNRGKCPTCGEKTRNNQKRCKSCGRDL